MKHHRHTKGQPTGKGHWRTDLDFVFKDGLLDRAVVNDSLPAPLILISRFDDIVHFFCRMDLKDFLQEQLHELENPPKQAKPHEELRVFREFTYGFTRNNAEKRQYTIFGGVWFFKNAGEPLDGHMAIGIAPVGMEGLVQNGIKNLLEHWKRGMIMDATFSVMKKGEEFEINN